MEAIKWKLIAEIQIRGKRPIVLGTCEDKEKKGEHSVGMPHGGKHRWNIGIMFTATLNRSEQTQQIIV